MGILMFPVRPQVEQDALLNFPQRRAATIAQELGNPILDVLPILRQEWRTTGQENFLDHCHYTSYGHKVLSQEIIEFVQEILNQNDP